MYEQYLTIQKVATAALPYVEIACISAGIFGTSLAGLEATRQQFSRDTVVSGLTGGILTFGATGIIHTIIGPNLIVNNAAPSAIIAGIAIALALRTLPTGE